MIKKSLNRLGVYSSVFAEKFVPDPWIYAVILTAIAWVAAVGLTPLTAWQVAEAWQNELWNKDILTLIAQFSVNLILCTALARSPWVQRFLIGLARIPKTPGVAVALIAFVSILLSQVSWALCIVGGALFAQEVCRQAPARGLRLHYPLAIAAGYIGMLAWGCGLTSSAPLISATPGHFLESVIGVVPVSMTLGSAANLSILVGLLILCPWMMASLHPTGTAQIKEFIPPPAEQPNDSREVATEHATFADRLENSAVLLRIGALLPATYLVNYYFLQGKSLTLDSMNLIFLVAVLLSYSTPRTMLRQLANSSSGVWCIVFQFPFYAGLMGLIKTTGLGVMVADGFARISSPATWPAMGVFSQGLLNLFVPSGGTQWIVTSDILIRTSQQLGFSNAQAILIEVMGDQITNMIQPMWALPALALSGLRARDIMGYTAVVMFAAYIVMVLGLTLFPA